MGVVKLYPDSWAGRLWRVLLDLLTAAWILAWAAAGYTLYRLVMTIEVVADGVTGTGRTLNRWLDSFQNSVPKGVPLVSDAFQNLATNLQHDGGEPLIQLGMQAHHQIEQLAIALGAAIAIPPILGALLWYCPWRWRDIREMAAVERFLAVSLRNHRMSEARAVLAHRALVTLPFRQLMRISPDPAGDLAAGRYDALADAMAKRVGVGWLKRAGD
jgi:hypothetical protein